jgi:hypothetical protein
MLFSGDCVFQPFSGDDVFQSACVWIYYPLNIINALLFKGGYCAQFFVGDKILSLIIQVIIVYEFQNNA